MDAQTEQVLIDLIIRSAVTAGEAIWNAIHQGDISAATELAKNLEPADQMLASDLALKQSERAKALAELGSAISEAATAPIFPRQDVADALKRALARKTA
jgi:Trk K+ transport system NAD-binding subunit